MATIDDILKEFPEPARSAIKRLWHGLPAAQRAEFAMLLKMVPCERTAIKDILLIILENYRDAIDQNKNCIAIVGPANVGKSTLYNQLVFDKEDQAKVGPTPGTTRENQVAHTGLFSLVDTPGANAAGQVGERERAIAFDAAGSVHFLVVMFEAGHGISRDEEALFGDLRALGKPYVTILNKMDLISPKDQNDVVNAAAHCLQLMPEQIIGISAEKGQGIDRLILAIAKAEPALLKAIGLALPDYRARLAWQRIVPAASLAAGVGFVPLPFADLVPLLGIQTGLVLMIARINGFDITFSRAKELLATFGIGFAARAVFQELSKFAGVPGWFLSAAISASTTVAIGYGAMAWFANGERPTQDALKRTTSEITLYLRDQLADLWEKRPEKGTLLERVRQALDSLPNRLRPVRNPREEAAVTLPENDQA